MVNGLLKTYAQMLQTGRNVTALRSFRWVNY